MKNYIVLSGILLSFFACYAGHHNVIVQLENQQKEKMKLLLGLIAFPESMNSFAESVCNNLRCITQKKSGFDCNIRTFDKVPSKSELTKLAQEGFNMVVFLKMEEEDDSLEWRVYDSLQAQMYCGKRMNLDSPDINKSIKTLSDALWKLLTGQDGIFSTKIAYCCEKIEGNHKGSDIYIKTPFVDDAICLVKGGRLLAPRWNKNMKNPLLLFSEVTPTNIRLVSTTMEGNKKIVSNFNGLNMLPSFSSEGTTVAYCATSEGTSQLYCVTLDKETKRRSCQRITNNNGNNTSPTLRDNGDIIFCSDYETKTPQIYYFHHDTQTFERKTHSGYCASPNFSEKNGKIAFCKLIDNTMQICTLDLATNKEEQLTITSGNKDECCWSPCGNYLVYQVEDGAASRIAIYNVITQEETFITDARQRCSYPSWSSRMV